MVAISTEKGIRAKRNAPERMMIKSGIVIANGDTKYESASNTVDETNNLMAITRLRFLICTMSVKDVALTGTGRGSVAGGAGSCLGELGV